MYRGIHVEMQEPAYYSISYNTWQVFKSMRLFQKQQETMCLKPRYAYLHVFFLPTLTLIHDGKYTLTGAALTVWPHRPWPDHFWATRSKTVVR